MAPRSEDPKVIIITSVITFELVQPISVPQRHDRQTDRQTDRRMDGRTTYDSNTALYHYVHRAVIKFVNIGKKEV